MNYFILLFILNFSLFISPNLLFFVSTLLKLNSRFLFFVIIYDPLFFIYQLYKNIYDLFEIKILKNCYCNKKKF